MGRFSQQALTRTIFVLIGFVIGLLDFYIKRPNVQPDAMESTYKAFAIVALLFIAELALEIRDNQRRDESKHEEFVRQNRNLTGSVLAELNTELQRAVKLEEDRLIVDHRTLAISSYVTFWKLLVDQKQDDRPLTIHTIHSCAIDVWVDHPLTKSLLNYQRDFWERGGRIIRIICDRAKDPKPEVVAAAETMAASGVEVKYYNLNSGLIDHSFAWDYAVVDETGDAAIWDSFANTSGSVIDTAIYTSSGRYKTRDLRDLWAKVAGVSKPLASPPQRPRNPLAVAM